MVESRPRVFARLLARPLPLALARPRPALSALPSRAAGSRLASRLLQGDFFCPSPSSPLSLPFPSLLARSPPLALRSLQDSPVSNRSSASRIALRSRLVSRSSRSRNHGRRQSPHQLALPRSVDPLRPSLLPPSPGMLTAKLAPAPSSQMRPPVSTRRSSSRSSPTRALLVHSSPAARIVVAIPLFPRSLVLTASTALVRPLSLQPGYVVTLVEQLSNEASGLDVRNAAGLALKNSLSARVSA